MLHRNLPLTDTNNTIPITTDSPIATRVVELDWVNLNDQLDNRGFAIINRLLSVDECHGVRERYREDNLYRSRVVMQRHGFGQGEYKYFRYPLPPLIADLRKYFYPTLVSIANRWNQKMKLADRYPPSHEEFLQTCHAAGQPHPTALLLRYTAGDYNCLHQDLYGDQLFPLQLAILLSQTGSEFSGGEFVITEQRPRRQSRVHVLPLDQGDAVIFAVNQRPVQSTRGSYRVKLRHGVSEIHSGQRHTLGIIFHDAK